MLENIKMVVFDMAGTTVDEHNVVYKTLQKSINDYGIDVDLETVLELGAGKEKHQAIKDVLSYLNFSKTEYSYLIFNNFKKKLNEAYLKLEVKPIDGVEEVLQKLREDNIRVVLNTGYAREVATNLLKKLNWIEGIHYDMLITASDVEKGRPHPEMIQKAMKEFNVSNAAEVLKAGDSGIDIEEGKNAGCGVTIGVLSGAQSREQLEIENPTYILNSLKELV
ncbi:phosphonatase-like hydrolase [uncultured Tenacibaculum sp.]|uniref:phosphonatase-like hydrolase n=1 Tax=uncultured Tenacibaculum sp. TaxID=174713 RepID=UPI002608C26B|nr:phosphonatase-like hydrolase [uncultured Tenacibaculum sp.]